jgi:hypothetical protein
MEREPDRADLEARFLELAARGRRDHLLLIAGGAFVSIVVAAGLSVVEDARHDVPFFCRPRPRRGVFPVRRAPARGAGLQKRGFVLLKRRGGEPSIVKTMRALEFLEENVARSDR